MLFKPTTGDPERIRLWSLREDALVESAADDQLLVFTRWGDIEIDDPSPIVREWLYRMSLGPVSLENLLPVQARGGEGNRFGSMEDDPEYLRVRRVLEKLGSCVVHSLGLADMGGPLLSAVPISRQANFELPVIDADHPVRLSRFAAMRASDGEVVLESPLARHRVVFHRSLATRVVGSLGKATTIADLAPALDVAESLVADIVSYVAAVGMVVLAEGEGNPLSARFAEDTDPSLLVWSHNDLLFHSRSRLGRDDPRGAVFPHGDKLPPPPAVKPVPEGPRFPLYKPVLADVTAADPPFTEVLEKRRSFRKFARRPLTAQRLGELLFRSARIRSVRPADGGGVSYAVSDRPYPSSASLHELELYLTLDRCTGLPRGIYHYDPLGHALTLINTSEDKVGELLDDAKVATGSLQRPPALITVTARMGRLSWMYNGIAYATTLRHVGVLQQTLYLVATAMELAPCALSVGDIEVCDSAFLLDWPAEVTVGGFVVGLRPEAIPERNRARQDP